ncbi:acetyl-CoA carboxylase biotin carboxyl carrier protein [Streptococcus dentapri]|uniref:Biotin carboxyl carrier protein of acetyl-CoA carboxylase n=1 Tax=Streptococcus dentapri TaxID=573564 RepID=A0ABV8D1H8_9STRE
MNLSEIKELMSQFDGSSLREFSYNNNGETLVFSKNDTQSLAPAPTPVVNQTPVDDAESAVAPVAPISTAAEGDVVESPLVGVAYLAPAPDKPAFVSVGDNVKKGQTLLIIEAMKVMNEVPAPRDGIVTEVLVDNEEVIEFGKGLVRIK